MIADRKSLLKKLINTRFDGNQAAFARAIKKSPNQVNQWLTGYRSIGDGTARNIETILELGALWFDGNEHAALPALTLQAARDPILDDLAVLSPHEAERWRIRIKAAADERRLDLRAAQEAGRPQGDDRRENISPHDQASERRRTSN